MKKRFLVFNLIFAGKLSAVAALMCVAATSSLFAQGGDGRITPTTRGTSKPTTTTNTTRRTTGASTSTARRPQTTTRNTTRNTTRTTTRNTRTFEDYFELGITAFDQKDYEKAIANFTQAIRLNPRHANSYYNRALSYYYIDEFEKAIDDYTKSIQIEPSAEAYNNRGIAYEENGNFRLAADDYRMALRLKPGYSIARNNLERVEREYNLNNSGGNSNGGGRAGDKNTRNNNQNVNNQGGNRDAAYYVGLADEYFDRNDFTNALVNYNRAIQINPQDASPYVRRGFSFHYIGEVAKAYQDYETAVRLRPALRNEAYIRCMLYDVTEDDARQGANVCTTTINEFPRFSLAYYKRGVAYRQLQDYPRALQDFTKSIELVPSFFNSYIYRGLIYVATNRYTTAIPEYTKAIQIVGANDPRAYLAYNNRGYAYEMSGNLSQAASDYRKALELNPEFTTARDNLNRVLQKQRNNY